MITSNHVAIMEDDSEVECKNLKLGDKLKLVKFPKINDYDNINKSLYKFNKPVISNIECCYCNHIFARKSNYDKHIDKCKINREFYKDKKILLFLTNTANLPINIYGYINELRGVLGYKKCLKEIEVLQKELKIYD